MVARTFEPTGPSVDSGSCERALNAEAEVRALRVRDPPAQLHFLEQFEAMHFVTPAGKYFVVRGRLWRMSNPELPLEQKQASIKQLMDARRRLRGLISTEERERARQAVNAAKHELGERGPVWWTDGAPDFNRKMACNTPYADWYAAIQSATAESAGPWSMPP